MVCEPMSLGFLAPEVAPEEPTAAEPDAPMS